MCGCGLWARLGGGVSRLFVPDERAPFIVLSVVAFEFVHYYYCCTSGTYRRPSVQRQSELLSVRLRICMYVCILLPPSNLFSVVSWMSMFSSCTTTAVLQSPLLCFRINSTDRAMISPHLLQGSSVGSSRMYLISILFWIRSVQARS